MSWLSDLFSGGKKKQEAQQIVQPAENPTFKLRKLELLDRLAGRKVGFPETFLGLSAPFATARRAELTNYELPQISSQASARNLGRSSIPVSRAALSTQEASRDIESRIADLALRNEQQKRAEINNALTELGGVANTEIAAENARAEAAVNASNYNRAVSAQGGQRLLSTAAGAIIGGMTGGPPGAVAGGISGYSSGGGGDFSAFNQMALTDYYNKLLGKGAAQVNIPSKDITGFNKYRSGSMFG